MDIKKSIHDESYEEILSDAMEVADGEDADRALRKFRPVRDMAIFRSVWGKVVLLGLLLNIVWFTVYGTDSVKLATLEQANEELRKEYGEDYKVFEAVDALAEGDIRTKRDLRPALNELNAAFGDDEPVFLEENFYLFGDTIVYTEHQREQG